MAAFLTNGMLRIDTNLIENTIRPITLGHKNYLFCGSHAAAQNAAIIYNMIGTYKLHDVNTYQWLKSVLTQMPSYTSSKIIDLLPHNRKGMIEP